MTYPPPNNPYQQPPQQPGYGQPGYGQPPSQPGGQHFPTDADPYARPDAGPGHYPGTPPMNTTPGSAPPGPPSQPFQPGQFAPPPKSGPSNMPLLVTLVVIAIAVIGGSIFVGMTLSGDEAGGGSGGGTTEETTEPSPSALETTSDEPTPEETTPAADPSAEYREPQIDECIEDSTGGFYVVDCDSAAAYWLVLHIAYEPDDPEPDDPQHEAAALDACNEVDWTTYYFSDSAVEAGHDWDPAVDTITAIYCVRPV